MIHLAGLIVSGNALTFVGNEFGDRAMVLKISCFPETSLVPRLSLGTSQTSQWQGKREEK
jgi:hypothetical protein